MTQIFPNNNPIKLSLETEIIFDNNDVKKTDSFKD